jgi:predicted N-acetyltransferase YhbS
MEIVEVGPGSQHLEAFFDLTPAALYGIDFRAWHESGGWDATYRAFTLLDGGRAVANVSFVRMRVRVSGRDLDAYQLATVGTHPDHRGRGHSRRLMTHVLDRVLPGAPVFLFANESTTGFYPRFGFRPWGERVFRCREEAPTGRRRFRRLSLGDREDLRILRSAVEAADPASDLFSARPLWGVVLFYALQGYGDSFHWCEDLGVVLSLRQVEEGYEVHDVFWRAPVDLKRLHEGLGGGRAEFTLAFAPDRLGATPVAASPYRGSPLFARGLDLPAAPFKFPRLSQT